MKSLPFTEVGSHAVILLPNMIDQNDWLGLRDLVRRQFIDRGQIQLVIDCEACPDLPSLAYGAFASLSRDLRMAGGSLHLIHVSEKVRNVLTRTRMDVLIPVRGTLSEVVNGQPIRSCGPKPPGS